MEFMKYEQVLRVKQKINRKSKVNILNMKEKGRKKKSRNDVEVVNYVM